ncbi:MAG: hypothetical protein IKO93_12115, partial [Lentisphaeria bacterium]|nr:hypothetical protein [Lentisphaeria bacterium]
MNAKGRQNLSGLWDFAFLPEGTSLADSLAGLRFETLAAVPGCFDLMPEYYLRRGTGVYRRQVEAGGEMELISDGLGLRGEIYWDRQRIAVIDAPFSRRSIRFDAGKSGRHELIIAVNNEFDDTPSSLFRRNYDFYAHGGLFRPVTLAPASAIRAEELKIIPLGPEKGTVRIAVRFSGKTAGLTQAEVRFDRQEKSLVLPLENGSGEQFFQVPSPHLWSPDDPFLHQAEISVGGEVFAVEFGLRKIECRAGKLYLNGKELFLKGVNRHDQSPLFGASVPETMWVMDLQNL